MIKLFKEFEYHPGRTSVNQISYGLRFLVENIPSKINLDYGGGRYNTGTEYLSENEIQNLIYDKFNRTKEYNDSVLKQIKEYDGVDSVTLLNVLNVIKEKKTRIFCIKDAFSYLKNGGSMIVTTYAGKSNDEGELTKKITWQENRKLTSYVDEIREALGNEVKLDFYKKCIVIRKTGRIVESSDDIKTEKGSVIKRSKYGVGKDIGDYIYVLNGYELDIIDEDLLKKFYSRVIKDSKIIDDEFKLFYYDNSTYIMKIKKDFSSITMINSPDFNESEEPYIKNWFKIDIDGKTTYGESNTKNPTIYHHKWLFVKDDYDGFDVGESKRRSKLWLSLPGIDFSRIGYKKYWEENVVPRIERIKKRNHNVDPFGEEFWYEIKEGYKMSDGKIMAIEIKDEYEYNILIDKLYSMGYEWLTTKKEYVPAIEVLYIGDGGDDDIQYDRRISYDRADRKRYRLVNFQEALSILSKTKLNKIRNSEIDPFNEEDWGYVEN